MVENELCDLGIAEVLSQHVANPTALLTRDLYFARRRVAANVIFLIQLLFAIK